MLPAPQGSSRRYGSSLGQLVVPAAAPPRTMGRAFEVWLQLQTAPRPPLLAAAAGMRLCGPALRGAYGQLLDRLGPAGPGEQSGRQLPLHDWTGPSPALDQADLARLCWVAGLMVEVYPARRLPAGSPLAALPRHPAPEELLALVPPDAVEELQALAALAREQLLLELVARSGRGPTYPGARLPGSALMPADVDLITGRTLVEVKVEQGTRTAGGRRLSLTSAVVWQLLGYVLHDLDDHYALNAVGLYQARYGHLQLWSLPELLEDLAGRPVDLPAVRGRWRQLLTELQATRPRPPALGDRRPV